MRHYIALLHKDAGSDYGVSFPDLPGCITAGRTLDEAHINAEDALSLHLAGMAEDAQPVPQPSSLDEIMRDAENRDGVAVLVAAREEPFRSVRINISLPEDVLAKIDIYAAKVGMNRSGFLAYAAKREIEKS